jgi:hypothetical protein
VSRLFYLVLLISLLACHQDKPIKEDDVNILRTSDQPTTSSSTNNHSDSAEFKVHVRPDKSQIINSSVDTSMLFKIWTIDPNGPHADFWIRRKDFYIVDYDGDGSIPYILENETIRVYYEDFITEGKILLLTQDSLIIYWKDMNVPQAYIEWKN